MKMRYPVDYDFDAENEAEAEFQDFRKEMRIAFDNIALFVSASEKGSPWISSRLEGWVRERQVYCSDVTIWQLLQTAEVLKYVEI